MHHKPPLSSLLSLLLLTSPILASPSDTAVCNANHIFNAIHSSMRQWGGSLHHNGMSFFLATVPAGTQLYYGTSEAGFVAGMEWLAFEPEHALIFARPRGRQRSSTEGGLNGGERQVDQGRSGELARSRWGEDWEYGQGLLDHGEETSERDLLDHKYGPRKERFRRRYGPASLVPPDPEEHHDSPSSNPKDHSADLNAQRSDKKRSLNRPSQHPLVEPKSRSDKEPVGYLHTYAPKHHLQLLYIDGLSAGKTPNGTLDTQDRLLLNLTDTGGPWGREMLRANGLCSLAATTWQGKIHGFIRLEGGFEIILCDFGKHLHRTDLIAITPKHSKPFAVMGGWQYIKAITSRYHGIGGARVHIDYDAFASVFAHEQATGLWDNDVQSDEPMPRLTNVPARILSEIRDTVTALVLSKQWSGDAPKGKDWQAVADQIVARYSAPLHYITTHMSFRVDSGELATYLATLLHPFLDANTRDTTREIQRCTLQILPVPLSHASTLAHRALHAVTVRICSTLLAALASASAVTATAIATATATAMPTAAAPTRPNALGAIHELVAWLQWTSWKECKGCADEEVCFVPMWPMGSHEDHARPVCRDEAGVEGRSGYWGRGWAGALDGVQSGERWYREVGMEW